MTEKTVVFVFAIKQDVETRDDFELAYLELYGLSGVRPQAVGASEASLRTIVLHAESLGLDVGHLVALSADRNLAPVFVARLAMVSHLFYEGPSGEVQTEPVAQASFEREAGASGLGSALVPSSRKKNEYLSHSFHKYKAKFFPRLARSLTNLVAADGIVADPYMGSGTLAIEAALMGVSSRGLDLDPLSVFIANTKVAALSDPPARIDAAIDFLATLSSGGLVNSRVDPMPPPIPDFIARRMDSEVRSLLEGEIIDLVSRVSASALSENAYVKLALSHALSTKISLRWMGTGDPRFAISVARSPLKQIFTRQLGKIATGFAQRDRLAGHGHIDIDNLGQALIEVGDARKISWPDGAVDGIVTSPPYLPASSGRETYLRSRAIPLMALGLMNEEEILARENSMVGSITRSAPHDSSGLPDSVTELVSWMLPQRARGPKALPTAAYFLDIAESLREMARVLRVGGRLALVLSYEHVFYDLLTRETVRTLNMPETIELLMQDPVNNIPLEIESITKLPLPKMDYAARPASRGAYAEVIIVARRI